MYASFLGILEALHMGILRHPPIARLSDSLPFALFKAYYGTLLELLKFSDAYFYFSPILQQIHQF